MSPPQPQPETPITPLTATTLENLLSPLLLSLPTSTVAPSAPTALLPLLSPILRQRVQYLSSTSNEPWLPLLSYDTSATSISKLKELAESEKIEPHPVSQEIEIDWDHDVSVKYRRVDQETLHAIVGLQHFGLGARCIWCVGDTEGGGDGWRIGELILFPTPETELSKSSITEAEAAFKSNNNTASKKDKDGYLIITNGATEQAEAIEEDDDDDYWAQYDNTPARTPGPEMNGGSSAQQQPAPMVFGGGREETQEDEDNYYAQYATVQPSMDQHDPDTEVPPGIESSLNHHHLQNGNSHEIRRELDSHPELTSTSSAWETAHGESQLPLDIRQPRPGSSSSGEDTVARLEREAEKRSEGSGSSREEMGVKQHIGTSIKSLYRLARVAGIDRAEFERLIHTELECLSLMVEDD